MTESKQICGADLLRNPQLNRADAFTQEERDARGLRGLLPPAVSTMELQVKRTLALLDRCPTALDKFLMLDSLHATDEDLYFKILIDYIDDYMPVVYTPTVGEVCQKFSHIYRYPRGAFISINDKGRVREIIENCPNEEVDVIVVTDGQRILGLGDLGINGMGIPCGKLSLYTACAGIAPEKTLPVTIDVGTNNPEYLNDPMYLGLRQERVTGEAYDELIEEFVTEARRRWPNVLIQFEDFGNNHAFDLLERYKDKVLCFNDDIQGTAAVAVTGVYSALRVTKQKLADQRFLFLGAGEAATGIAELLVDAMVAEGVEREEALKHCFLFDSKGLVTCNRGDKLAHNKVPFAHDVENCKTFIEAVRALRPTGIIGVAAQPGAFNAEVLGAMAEINERPIVFALSNPTSRAECDAATAYRETNGRALFASGSPFAPVDFNGKTFVPRQGNNSYVFPGLGLGAVFARAKTMPVGMFLAASRELAELVSEADLEQGSLYPPLSTVREVSVKIGAAVAQYAYDNGLAGNERPADLEAAVREAAATHDFVVTSGGASNGDFDFIKPVVERAGELLMTTVNMRPGKAQTFGIVDGTPVFGLPGNPAAAYMGFELIIRAGLLKMQGRTAFEHPTIVAKLTCDKKKKDPRRLFMRATLSHGESGELLVTPAKNQSSGLFGPIQKTNCMAVLPEGAQDAHAGDEIACVLLDVAEGTVI